MASLQSLKFDRTGWILFQESESKLVFGNDAKEPSDVLSVHYFPIPPDIVAPLNDIKTLRDSYRSGANQAGAGLISADILTAGGVPAVKTLLKFPQEPTGMTYVGSISMPFRDFSYVVKVQCFEVGMTGAREAVVMAHLLQEGKAEIDPEKNRLKGWSTDPYDPEQEFPNMPNMAEDEQWDGEFAGHPLTRVRRHLEKLLDTLDLDDELFEAEPFRGPPQ